MTQPPRQRLSRDVVLTTAVRLADERGADELSMRKLAAELGVVPMALYKHVANKEALLDAMVEHILRELPAVEPHAPWRLALRRRVLEARSMLLRHPWARHTLETRTTMGPVVLDYLDAIAKLLRSGGFSDVLAHHAMHALGSRVWGFTQELFLPQDDAPVAPPSPEQAAAMAARWPHVAAVAAAASHADDAVGAGCDDLAEFVFALDLMLDGLERLREQGWTPTAS